MQKFTVKRETVMVPNGFMRDDYELTRWVVRRPNNELAGYSSTWAGAWGIVCNAFGKRYDGQ